jgi:predicted deacylase
MQPTRSAALNPQHRPWWQRARWGVAALVWAAVSATAQGQADAGPNGVLQGLARRTPPDGITLGLSDFGRSQQGRPLLALRLTAATGDGAARPAVLLLAGQHGDEPDGSEALLRLAQQLADGRLPEVLKAVDVFIVPSLNPDGAHDHQPDNAAGLNIGRDHLRLQSPEARALAGLLNEADPTVLVDFQQQPGGDPAADLLLQRAATPAPRAFIARAADEWILAPLQTALLMTRRSSLQASPPADDAALDSAWAVAGLRNAIGLRVAIAPGQTEAAVDVAVQLLRSAARRAGDLLKLRHYVSREVAAQACQGELRVAGATRPRPCAYWLAADAEPTVARLRQLGLQVDTLQAATSVLGSQYLIERPADGSPRLVLRDALLDLPAGSHVVRLSQPLAGLASVVLEPTVDGTGAVARLDQLAALRAPLPEPPREEIIEPAR